MVLALNGVTLVLHRVSPPLLNTQLGSYLSYGALSLMTYSQKASSISRRCHCRGAPKRCLPSYGKPRPQLSSECSVDAPLPHPLRAPTAQNLTVLSMFLTSSPIHLLQPQARNIHATPLAIRYLLWGLEAQERDTALQDLMTANDCLSILILQASLYQPSEPSVSTTHIMVAQNGWSLRSFNPP